MIEEADFIPVRIVVCGICEGIYLVSSGDVSIRWDEFLYTKLSIRFRILNFILLVVQFFMRAMFSAYGSPMSTMYGRRRIFFANTAINPGYDGGVTTWIMSISFLFLMISRRDLSRTRTVWIFEWFFFCGNFGRMYSSFCDSALFKKPWRRMFGPIEMFGLCIVRT